MSTNETTTVTANDYSYYGSKISIISIKVEFKRVDRRWPQAIKIVANKEEREGGCAVVQVPIRGGIPNFGKNQF